MNKLLMYLISFLFITGCSFKIPAGTYSTAKGPSFAGTDFTLTENGRFQYRKWSDDHPGIIGHGAYIVIGNYLLLIFENADIPESGYSIQEVKCTQQDSQVVNFRLSNPKGEPIPFASIYNKHNSNQGTMSLLEGEAQITMLKSSGKKVFIPHLMWLEDLEIEFDGDKCLDIDVTIKNEIERLQRGKQITYQLKRDGEQLYFKKWYKKKFNEIYLRE